MKTMQVSSCYCFPTLQVDLACSLLKKLVQYIELLCSKIGILAVWFGSLKNVQGFCFCIVSWII